MAVKRKGAKKAASAEGSGLSQGSNAGAVDDETVIIDKGHLAEWLPQFQGSPFFQQAAAVAREEIALERERVMRQQATPEPDNYYKRWDALSARKDELILQLAEHRHALIDHSTVTPTAEGTPMTVKSTSVDFDDLFKSERTVAGQDGATNRAQRVLDIVKALSPEEQAFVRKGMPKHPTREESNTALAGNTQPERGGKTGARVSTERSGDKAKRFDDAGPGTYNKADSGGGCPCGTPGCPGCKDGVQKMMKTKKACPCGTEGCPGCKDGLSKMGMKKSEQTSDGPRVVAGSPHVHYVHTGADEAAAAMLSEGRFGTLHTPASHGGGGTLGGGVPRQGGSPWQ